MTTYLIQNAAVLGGTPTDLLLQNGVIARIGEISAESAIAPSSASRSPASPTVTAPIG